MKGSLPLWLGSDLIDAHVFTGIILVERRGVMSDEIMARIGSHGYLSAGSQSLVLDGHEVDYYLVLVFYGRILGLRS